MSSISSSFYLSKAPEEPTKELSTAEERTNRAKALSVTPNSQKDSAAIFSLSQSFNSVPDISLGSLIYNSTAKYQSISSENSASVEQQIKDLVAVYKPASKR